jgi:hypothetical protein
MVLPAQASDQSVRLNGPGGGLSSSPCRAATALQWGGFPTMRQVSWRLSGSNSASISA